MGSSVIWEMPAHPSAGASNVRHWKTAGVWQRSENDLPSARSSAGQMSGSKHERRSGKVNAQISVKKPPPMKPSHVLFGESAPRKRALMNFLPN